MNMGSFLVLPSPTCTLPPGLSSNQAICPTLSFRLALFPHVSHLTSQAAPLRASLSVSSGASARGSAAWGTLSSSWLQSPPILIKPQTTLAFASAVAGEGRLLGWGWGITSATRPGPSRGQAKILIWLSCAQEGLAMPAVDTSCPRAGDLSLASGFYWRAPRQLLWDEL